MPKEVEAYIFLLIKSLYTMKQFLLSVFWAFAFTQVFAQKDVTTFLGIPVDGTKSEMINKLKAKGFVHVAELDLLKGIFNGTDSYIGIQTNNNNIVWRIVVIDANPSSETEIKYRYNYLFDMFCKKKDKYVGGSKANRIPEDERISYEMTVHNKRYEASFFQAVDTTLIDFETVRERLNNAVKLKFSEEQLQNPTIEEKAEIGKFVDDEINKQYYELLESKHVWFMINEKNGEYFIFMYYENKYNNTIGDDL